MSIHLDLNPAQASALQQLLVRESLRQSKLTKPRPIYNSRAMVAWDKQRATDERLRQIWEMLNHN